MYKKLYRSETDKKIAGVCAGVAEYLNVDPTFIRLIWALVSLWGGAGIVGYVVAAVVIPVRSEVE